MMKNKSVMSIFTGLLLGLPLASQALDQWASKVVAFSSQYGTSSWSAAQATKAPNTNAYGDNSTAWTTSTQNAGTEYITLGYTTPVYATGITVRETDGYGFVTRVDVIDTANVSHLVWTGTDTSLANQINNFAINWTRTTYLVKSVKVTINTAIYSGWEEIDAVQLHGVQPLSGTVAPRFGHTANLVCTNTTTAQIVSITISGTGTTTPVTQWNCEGSGLTINPGDTVKVQITGTVTP